jgi:mgtE-like transporter
MKEYGPKSHVSWVIVKESFKILLLASIISSIGGTHLKIIENNLISIIPLLILLPALNDMIGDLGTIISSKFTTMLYLGLSTKRWWESDKVREMIKTIFMVAFVSSIYIGCLSYLFAYLKGFQFSAMLFLKVILVSVIATLFLVGIVIMISVVAGIWIYNKKEDPNNFLIPITTSIADLGSLLLFAFLVSIFF